MSWIFWLAVGFVLGVLATLAYGEGQLDD